jgi:hypothetical protein
MNEKQKYLELIDFSEISSEQNVFLSTQDIDDYTIYYNDKSFAFKLKKNHMFLFLEKFQIIY